MGLHILNLLNEGSVARPHDYCLSGLRLNGDFVFGRKIGAGTFGLIYLVEDLAGRQYAAKILMSERGAPESNAERVYRTFSQPQAVKELDFGRVLAWADSDRCSNAERRHRGERIGEDKDVDNEEIGNEENDNEEIGNEENDNEEIGNEENDNEEIDNKEINSISNPKTISKISSNPTSQAEYSDISNDPFLSPFKSLLQEVALHLKVHHHQNIATLHHVYTVQDQALVAVMDYFPDGDLFGAIIDGQIFSNPPPTQNRQLLMKNCMLQLIDAIHHCASHGVYHCDLKPENIMVSYNRAHVRQSNEPVDYDELRITLIDFGLAMSSKWVCCNVCRGSNFYMAPERIVNFNNNKLVKSLLDMAQFHRGCSAHGRDQVFFPTLAGDVWSLGVLFINVTCARNPWPIANIDDRQDVFFTYILRDKYVLSTILPISKQFNELLNSIFALNPNERASLASLAQMVKACDFFNDCPTPLDSPEPILEDLQVEVSLRKDVPKRAYTDIGICKQQLRVFDPYDHSRYVS